MNGKKIILGVTGSIAAYKAAIFVRLLIKAGAEVKVIMTSAATEFITPLTLATLSKNPVSIDFFDSSNGDWDSHVELGLWADAMIIAPATANTMAKMANGIACNLLLTTYLSARCPVFVAAAMDLDMYQHPSTLRNIEILQSYGNHFIEASSGELASGLIGQGRMEEPELILAKLKAFFDGQKKLDGKKILVTAGPTYEQIDPVRFIGNHSSGKMGYAIAEELAKQGAQVSLVSGPTSLKATHPNIETILVQSAQEMYDASIQVFENADAAIMSAAVADYTPAIQLDQKMKRKSKELLIELVATKDIAAELGSRKKPNQLLIGFALETNNEEENARKKILSKNLDFIVLNSLQDAGAGFGKDTNKITIIDKNNKKEIFKLKSKTEVAHDIVQKMLEVELFV